MPTPTEHKTVQARIIEYSEAEGRDIGNWRLDIGDSRREIGDLRLEIRERREDFGSESLSSLRSLRFSISEFRGLNRRERRDRKEDLDWTIWPHVAAMSSCLQFWHRLFQKLVTACRQILEQAVQERILTPEIP